MPDAPPHDQPREDDYRQVSLLAETDERSLNWVISKAIKEYLEKRRVAEQLDLFARKRRR